MKTVLQKAGMIRRKECWALTWRGRAILLLSAVAVVFAAVHQSFPFLSVHDPVEADVLVVEGWLPDYALEEVREEFEAGNYRLLIVTGNPISKGQALLEFNNYAELTRAILLAQGWPPDQVISVPSGEALRDRTFHAALALRSWGVESGVDLTAFNVLSRGAHCRRTRLLYRKAFEGAADVGVISGVDPRFDGTTWWKSSEGVREVINETIAYGYAKFLFRP